MHFNKEEVLVVEDKALAIERMSTEVIERKLPYNALQMPSFQYIHWTW